LGAPIWAEDTDFFGCGVAPWATGRIEFISGQYRPSESSKTFSARSPSKPIAVQDVNDSRNRLLWIKGRRGPS